MSGPENPLAFPHVKTEQDRVIEYAEGMTLRDYFAVHADQPGVSEIVAMAGGETDGFRVKFCAGGSEYKFNDWWNDLPIAERLMLSARVRYAMADAMLAAREVQS